MRFALSVHICPAPRVGPEYKRASPPGGGIFLERLRRKACGGGGNVGGGKINMRACEHNIRAWDARWAHLVSGSLRFRQQLLANPRGTTIQWARSASTRDPRHASRPSSKVGGRPHHDDCREHLEVANTPRLVCVACVRLGALGIVLHCMCGSRRVRHRDALYVRL